MILTQLIKEGKDIRFSDIPDGWRDSFDRFMYGQTMYIDTDTNEHMAYFTDYARWYFKNENQIVREEKIDQIKN